jgi:hypothetical protein
MVTNANESKKTPSSRSEPPNIFLCNCPVELCTQNYSPEMGYFAMERVQDHWFVTDSSSLKLHRNETQVLCGDAARNVMILERIDPKIHEQIFRCPQQDCGKTMKIPADGPPSTGSQQASSASVADFRTSFFYVTA